MSSLEFRDPLSCLHIFHPSIQSIIASVVEVGPWKVPYNNRYWSLRPPGSRDMVVRNKRALKRRWLDIFELSFEQICIDASRWYRLACDSRKSCNVEVELVLCYALQLTSTGFVIVQLDVAFAKQCGPTSRKRARCASPIAVAHEQSRQFI
jgi:hypothetical protein